MAQVLLTLPYSFSQLGMLSGILFQLFYGLLGSWTAYLISVLYVEYRTRKEREKVDFRNHVIQVWFHAFNQLDDMKKTSFLFFSPLIFAVFSHGGFHVLKQCSGLRFLMGCLESTGGTWAWHLTALFFCLDLSFNSLLVQGIPANSDPSFNSILILYE